jgi:hypothetical protein
MAGLTLKNGSSGFISLEIQASGTTQIPHRLSDSNATNIK